MTKNFKYFKQRKLLQALTNYGLDKGFEIRKRLITDPRSGPLGVQKAPDLVYVSAIFYTNSKVHFLPGLKFLFLL